MSAFVSQIHWAKGKKDLTGETNLEEKSEREGLGWPLQ